MTEQFRNYCCHMFSYKRTIISYIQTILSCISYISCLMHLKLRTWGNEKTNFITVKSSDPFGIVIRSLQLKIWIYLATISSKLQSFTLLGQGKLKVPFICWSCRMAALLCYHSIAPCTCKSDTSVPFVIFTGLFLVLIYR